MADDKRLADNLWRYAKIERVSYPQGYNNYLMTHPRFKGCGLDGLPPYAIILHDARVEDHLVRLGYSARASAAPSALRFFSHPLRAGGGRIFSSQRRVGLLTDAVIM